jgi:hypothetical protein
MGRSVGQAAALAKRGANRVAAPSAARLRRVVFMSVVLPLAP